MALLTLADMEQEVRDNILDADSANLTFTQAQVYRFLNRCYGIVRGIEDDRTYFVAATASGASFAPTSANGFKLLTETTYKRILAVYPAENNAATKPYGPPLARWTPDEMFRMQVEDGTNREIYATAYAAFRAGTATAASVGKWNLALWPFSTVAYDYVLAVLKEITALASGTDKADGTEADHHLIVDMASLVAARLAGRPEELISDIRTRIPEQMQAAAMRFVRELTASAGEPQAEAV